MIQDEVLSEPFRIKVIEKIRLPSREERIDILNKAFYSVAYLDSNDVYIDLATDSGTGAMSDDQWSALMKGDEAYIRSKSYFAFEQSVQAITSYPFVIPTHQGRAAENILMELLVKPGDYIISNTFFDTTRAHVQNKKAIPLDLIGDQLWDFTLPYPFKGNFDIEKLAVALEKYHEKVPFILITIVNNLACSSPVSMENIRAVKALADKYHKPVYFDACRFAENAYFIKTREPGYQQKSIVEIAHEMFSHGEGCFMSAKKDAIVNVGGFIALKDEKLARRCQELLVLYEGFPTYGGLARRDLSAIAVGLQEGINEDYLKYRVGQVAYLAELLEKNGIAVSKPAGGSGVFIDVQSIYPHLTPEQLPGIALACDAYIEGAVRLGAIPFHLNCVDPRTGAVTERHFEFARLAIPRRVYTKAHMDYVAKVLSRVKEKAVHNKGYRLTYAPEVLAHFFARFEPLN